jgi:hypothetical protein
MSAAAPVFTLPESGRPDTSRHTVQQCWRLSSLQLPVLASSGFAKPRCCASSRRGELVLRQKTEPSGARSR